MSNRIRARADLVIPHKGQGTPIIVSNGHGGIGENGRTIPKAARPMQPITSQRNGPSGTAIDDRRLDPFGAQEDE